MSTEIFTQSPVTEAKPVPNTPAAPKHVVPVVELDQWKQNVNKGLDMAAETYLARQWDSEHGLGPVLPDGTDRKTRIQDTAERALKEEVAEWQHPSDSGLGLSEPHMDEGGREE